MKLLYGKPIADEILDRLKSDISMCEEKPGLAVILVGDNNASKIYVSLKEKAAQAIGMNFFRFDFAKDIPDNDIIDLVQKLNTDEKIHGIVLQLPLPEGFDSGKIISKIDSKKDVDGFLAKSEKDLQPVFSHAIMLLAESSGEILENKKAVIVANSDEFGKVMAATLALKNISAGYFIAKDISANLGKIKESDIVVSAVGSPGLLEGQMFKEGAVIIDGGIEKVGEKVMGDVNFAGAEDKEGFLSPVPGGVGPLTIACLLQNVFLAFKAQQKEK